MITFPTTTEAFIAYQEAGINRKLDDLEQKLSGAVVDLAKALYELAAHRLALARQRVVQLVGVYAARAQRAQDVQRRGLAGSGAAGEAD